MENVIHLPNEYCTQIIFSEGEVKNVHDSHHHLCSIPNERHDVIFKNAYMSAPEFRIQNKEP